MPALASRGRARPCIPRHMVRMGNGDWKLGVGLGARGGVEAGSESKPRWPAERASDNFQLLPQLLP